MSHHLDSPIARQDIRLDITDLYVFRGQTGTVFIINVCHSIFGPLPAPGYHPEGMYEFKVDLNGDAIEDVTYRFTFNERDQAGKQSYVVRCISGADAVDPHAPGQVIAEGVTGGTVATAAGLRIWTGQAGDPFWAEPDVLHAVGHAFQDGTTVDLSGWDPSKAKNVFDGQSVYSIVLEVPDGELLAGAGDNRHIGVWAVATLATDAGGWRSINRIGLPMIHPLFAQSNPDLGDRLNAGRPVDDFATYGEEVIKSIAGVVSANGTAQDTKAYAETVAHRFFPNILRYEVGTPAVFGFAGVNGRSMTDNVPDVMCSIAANTPIHMGIGKESVTSKPSQIFPYVPAVTWKGFRQLRIVSKNHESDDVESLVLSCEDGAVLPPFLPGQHIVVRINLGQDEQGQKRPEQLRHYSLSGSPSTGDFRIGVKREPNGVVSTFIHQNLKVGDIVEVSAPRGDFVLSEEEGPVVLIGAGVGITPVLAMLHSLAESSGRPGAAGKHSERPVWWVYAAQDSRHHPFAEETRRLLAGMGNARGHVVYSRPLPSDTLGVDYDVAGHITTSIFDNLGIPKSADFYLCGPTGFMDAITGALKEWGAASPRIHIELFGPGPVVLDTAQKQPHLPEGEQGTGPNVSFTKSALTVHWQPRFHSILELAEACDVPVKWFCRNGVCHTCESGLIDGKVAYSPEPLDPPADGKLLICCSKPQGDVQLDL
jgi:ferredoxin-NADP reductase